MKALEWLRDTVMIASVYVAEQDFELGKPGSEMGTINCHVDRREQHGFDQEETRDTLQSSTLFKWMKKPRSQSGSYFQMPDNEMSPNTL